MIRGRNKGFRELSSNKEVMSGQYVKRAIRDGDCKSFFSSEPCLLLCGKYGGRQRKEEDMTQRDRGMLYTFDVNHPVRDGSADF